MAAAGQWCILRTSGRLTLPLAESLTGDGYEVWTPVDTRRVRVPRMNARRVVKHLADLLELERIRPGFRVMFYNGEPAKAPDHELEPLRQAEHMVEPKRWTSAFAPGSEVRITKGSFSGATGIVKSCNGKEAELWVSIFGRHHRVKINTFNLKLNRAYPVQAALAA
jgi:hypothetical protein